MPMIKGVKFACEPCMRGHRSSKCTHTDRILVKVRKPGRPLSSCPHTLSSQSPGTFVHVSPSLIASGKSGGGGGGGGGGRGGPSSGCGGEDCTCEVTSVAIPKVSSCACGTSQPDSKPQLLSRAAPASPVSFCMTQRSPPPPAPPPTPGSTVFTDGSANKVSKSNQRVKRKSVTEIEESITRRSSIIGDEAALELLLEKEGDQNKQVIAVEMGKPTNNINAVKLGNGHLDGVSGNANGNGESVDSGDYVIQTRQPVAGTSAPPVSGGPEPKPDTSIKDVMSADGWSAEEVSPWNNHSPSPLQVPISKPKGNGGFHLSLPLASGVSSCCSGGGQSKDSAKAQLPASTAATSPPLSAMGYFHTPQYSPFIPGQNFQTTPVWYPAGSSTINHPLTPQELVWLQQMRAGLLPAPPPPQQTLPLGVTNVVPTGNNTDGSSWSHNCGCGPDCDCLGCVSHPYNRRTVQYVKELRQFTMRDHSRSSCRQSHSQSQAQAQGPNGFSARGGSSSDAPTSQASNSSAPVTPSCCHSSSGSTHMGFDNSHSTTPPPDDDAGASDAGRISPSAFLYVDYPMATCSESEPGCKCGEGCTCIGCLSHGGHDGVVLCGDGWTPPEPSSSSPSWWEELGNDDKIW